MTAGRRRGGGDTRAEILAAARTEFGSGGFDATSIRTIAGAAGCDPALIHHYFGTKAELFRAALEIPIDPTTVAARVAGAPMGRRGRVIIDAVLDVWESPAGDALLAGLRTMLGTTAETALVKEFIFSQLIEPATAGLAGADRKWRRNLLASQMLGVLMARYVLKVEPMASLPPGDVAGAVAPTLQRYLTGALEPPNM